ncbi:hypothetical protein [Deinococcus aquatilis]|uniref:hypothetical protein n=1 Tax=Deinococcus aquatilis TaxID=519440 RepID=UPI0003658A80|nr:hypothetical protein [Deinococcus aquatilis]
MAPKRKSAAPTLLQHSATDPPALELPSPSTLSALVFNLTQDAAITGKKQAEDLGDGLRLHAYPVEGGPMGVGVALSHLGQPPGDALARELQQALGWRWTDVSHLEHGGRHWVKLEARAAPEPPPPQAQPPPKEDNPSSSVIRALLDLGPWVNHSLTAGMQTIRTAALQNMKRDELLDEYRWMCRHWPDAVTAGLAQINATDVTGA